MHIGIDISGDALRHQGLITGQEVSGTSFGVIGIPPRLAKESFVWNRRRAIRSSKPSKTLALAKAWRDFINNENSAFTWPYESGDTGQALMVNMLSDSFVQNIADCTSAKTVIAINNRLSESRQEALLLSLVGAGIADVELLWRPVAIALSFLDNIGLEHFEEDNQLLVVDLECYKPEATVLELRKYKDTLVPLRRAPKKDEHLGLNYDIYNIRREIAANIAGNDSNITNQLCAGPFAHEFIEFTENQPHGDVWCRRNNEHFRVNLDDPSARNILKHYVNPDSLRNILQKVYEKHDLQQIAAVLCHGWPFRVGYTEGYHEKEILLPSDSVCRGAALYADKLLAELPTYLDTLPGLYILSEVKELGTYAFFHLVKPNVIPGGHLWKRQEPLTRFSVRHGIGDFTTVLRRSDESKCRQLITKLPQKPSEDTPVLIRSKIRPAQGHASVTIEGADGHEDVFGDVRQVKLNWKSMTEVEIPIVFAPEVYPVRGRLFDDNDPEYLEVLTDFLDQNEATPYQEVRYRGRSMEFWKLMEPWGLKPPWHKGRGRPRDWTEQPTRGMFGSMRLPIEKKLIQRLGQRIIEKTWTQDRVKFLNYMFIYAPDSYKQDLRDKFTKDAPSFHEKTAYGRKRPSWNWVIAPGRVFSTRDDFELFIDFMLSHAEEGYPAYPDSSFTQHYWWSFFRCLCYHSDTVNVSPGKIINVLKMIHVFVNNSNRNNKVAKYCLCAILFSLRLRSRFPDFLQPGDSFCNDLVDDIRAVMPRVKYPPAMLSTIQDPHGEGLNGFVLRFLLQTASKEDFRALEGLTTSMA